ncbi:hypothetical protein BD310DRAFT_657583 [Dichomitus squalens]|uniref:Uncharacterized protein n=1 Tax=Dichomitus squalens TaxID=114155 RepID=A0A4Q9Q7F3_9APHY|nr:hypothetical protein BD310DRAFT_657583 [Dichomitus squalens]
MSLIAERDRAQTLTERDMTVRIPKHESEPKPQCDKLLDGTPFPRITRAIASLVILKSLAPKPKSPQRTAASLAYGAYLILRPSPDPSLRMRSPTTTLVVESKARRVGSCWQTSPISTLHCQRLPRSPPALQSHLPPDGQSFWAAQPTPSR